MLIWSPGRSRLSGRWSKVRSSSLTNWSQSSPTLEGSWPSLEYTKCSAFTGEPIIRTLDIKSTVCFSVVWLQLIMWRRDLSSCLAWRVGASLFPPTDWVSHSSGWRWSSASLGNNGELSSQYWGILEEKKLFLLIFCWCFGENVAPNFCPPNPGHLLSLEMMLGPGHLQGWISVGAWRDRLMWTPGEPSTRSSPSTSLPSCTTTRAQVCHSHYLTLPLLLILLTCR